MNLVAVIQAALNVAIGTEQNEDVSDDGETSARKQRHLRWLATLSDCLQTAEEWPTADRDTLAQALSDWLRDDNLQDVRVPQWLNDAPAEERAAWDAHWTLIERFAREQKRP